MKVLDLLYFSIANTIDHQKFAFSFSIMMIV